MSICARIEARPQGAFNTSRPLTRSSVQTRKQAPMKTTQCVVDDCERVDIQARGLCILHYARMFRLGTTDLPTMPTPAERLAAGLERKPNGCLEWTRATDENGYGRIGVDGKTFRTHRLAWGLAHPDEPLPPAVRHYVCDNPPCCDVEHLRPGTRAENNADMAAKGRGRGAIVNNGRAAKTHCKSGHAFDEANTYVDKRGDRSCRACHRASEAARRAKVRAG